MNNYLMSEAIGDIAGSAYEGRAHRISFLESKDYVDCIKLAIALGGDSDTLAAIAGPMAYAYYKKMPDALIFQAMKMLPDWMVDVSERFDNRVNGVG